MSNSRALPDFSRVNEKVFVDIPSSRPAIAINLCSVGVSNRPIILTVADPFSGAPITAPCSITVDCSLRSNQRGLHMSRIEEAFDEFRGAGLTVGEISENIAELVMKTQGQDHCAVSLEVQYENRVTKNPSGKSSVELITLLSSCKKSASESLVTLGLRVPFINACPCTQRWGMREFYSVLQKKGYDAASAEDIVRCAPLQAHTNRGVAELLIGSKEVSYTDLYQTLDQAVPIIRELLKGMDEHAVVSGAHQAGQFCEDNARAIVAKVADKFSPILPGTTKIDVSVEVDESVHFHNLKAQYHGTLEGIVINGR